MFSSFMQNLYTNPNEPYDPNRYSVYNNNNNVDIHSKPVANQKYSANVRNPNITVMQQQQSNRNQKQIIRPNTTMTHKQKGIIEKPPLRSEKKYASVLQQREQQTKPFFTCNANKSVMPSTTPIVAANSCYGTQIGCNLLSDSTIPKSRIQLDMLMNNPGNSLVDPKTVNIAVRDLQYGPANSTTPFAGTTPRWSSASDTETYFAKTLPSEYRSSMGVYVNSNLGKMYEFYQDEIPPPNTDQSIPREQFTKTNPKLIGMQGGFDYNAPQRRKTEISQKIPRQDGGSNVWGDQLYSDSRRQEMQTRALRQVYLNQNGNYATEKYDDRQPVGYVGYVNTMRTQPYMPPTHRDETQNNERVGPMTADETQKHGLTWDSMPPEITIHKPELWKQPYMRPQGPDASNENINANNIMLQSGNHLMPFTNRTDLENKEFDGFVDGTYAGAAAEPQQSAIDSIRGTLKTMMETTYDVANAAAEALGFVTVSSTDIRPTQKGIMSEQRPLGAIQTDTLGDRTVVDTDLRPTLKMLMENQYPVTTLSSDFLSNTGGTVIIDPSLRPTMKGLMEYERNPSILTADELVNTGGTVLIDPSLRPTMKGLMENERNPSILTANELINTGGTVIIDPSLRPTMKGIMAEQRPVANAQAEDTGDYIEFQGPLDHNKREYYEGTMRPQFVARDDIGQFDGVPQSDDARETLAYRGRQVNYRPHVTQLPQSTGGLSNAQVRPTCTLPTERDRLNPRVFIDPGSNPHAHQPTVLPDNYAPNERFVNTDSHGDPLAWRQWLPITYYTESTNS